MLRNCDLIICAPVRGGERPDSVHGLDPKRMLENEGVLTAKVMDLHEDLAKQSTKHKLHDKQELLDDVNDDEDAADNAETSADKEKAKWWKAKYQP